MHGVGSARYWKKIMNSDRCGQSTVERLQSRRNIYSPSGKTRDFIGRKGGVGGGGGGGPGLFEVCLGFVCPNFRAFAVSFGGLSFVWVVLLLVLINRLGLGGLGRGCSFVFCARGAGAFGWFPGAFVA